MTSVGAYYFPGYHSDRSTDRFHGHNWSEWELVREATARFEGHRQPRIPTWGYFDESDPEWALKQSELAAHHGIDFFIFDWYWYRGEPFLNKALDVGFLPQMDALPTQFALMWANHDWLNIHPSSPAHAPAVLFHGAVDERQFNSLADEVVDKYFVRPSYFSVDNRPYFSIYEPQTLVTGLGSVDKTRRAIDRLRVRAQRAGLDDIHLNLVVTDRAVLPGERRSADPEALIAALGADSTTSYVWIHHYDPSADGFPVGNYSKAAQVNQSHWGDIRQGQSVPYFPNVTVGWDSSPRTIATDRYENWGYPWMSVLDAQPEEFESAVKAALNFARNEGDGVVTINAWNEWTEGSYLLPDGHHGLAFLEALKRARQIGALVTGPSH